MKSTESHVIARRQAELEFMRQKRRTTVNELVALFGVSSMTISRDLHLFIKKGLVIHDYGSVIWIGDLTENRSISRSRQEQLIYQLMKETHGVKRILINASPITESLVQQFTARHQNVLTNQLILPTDPIATAEGSVAMTGGQLQREGTLLTYAGDTAVRTIRRHKADIALIYATGLNNRLLTTTSLPESIVSRTMFETAHKSIVFLADAAYNHESNFMIVKRAQVKTFYE